MPFSVARYLEAEYQEQAPGGGRQLPGNLRGGPVKIIDVSALGEGEAGPKVRPRSRLPSSALPAMMRSLATASCVSKQGSNQSGSRPSDGNIALALPPASPTCVRFDGLRL